MTRDSEWIKNLQRPGGSLPQPPFTDTYLWEFGTLVGRARGMEAANNQNKLPPELLRLWQESPEGQLALERERRGRQLEARLNDPAELESLHCYYSLMPTLPILMVFGLAVGLGYAAGVALGSFISRCDPEMPVYEKHLARLFFGVQFALLAALVAAGLHFKGVFADASVPRHISSSYVFLTADAENESKRGTQTIRQSV
jgi:hypothetical protein